jgi:hypothetical protein
MRRGAQASRRTALESESQAGRPTSLAGGSVRPGSSG